MPHLPASPALSHFTVLDLTRVRAGPTCVRQLADWGAAVSRWRGRSGPDGMNWAARAPGPTSRTSTATSAPDPEPEGGGGARDRLRMVERADVVVEHFRPDVKDRLGIGYDDLRAVNPRIVSPRSPASARTARLPSGPDSIDRAAWAA